MVALDAVINRITLSSLGTAVGALRCAITAIDTVGTVQIAVPCRRGDDRSGQVLIVSRASSVSVDTVIVEVPEVRSLTPSLLEKVTVSAQRYDQDAQSVPISVSPVSGKELEARGADGFDAFASRIPGLQAFGIGQNNQQLVARGISTERLRSNRSSTVAIYVDDVPVDLSGANPNYQLYDMERIEFLRGPQGTLFGAGAEAGALRLITEKPAFDVTSWSGGSELASTRSGIGNSLFHGVINAPIGHDAAVRASGYTREEAGYLDNPTLGLARTNSTRVYGGRVSTRVLSRSGLEITLTGMLQSNRDDDSDWYNPAAGSSTRTSNVLEPNNSVNGLGSVTVRSPISSTMLTSVTAYQSTNFHRDLEVGHYPIVLGATPGEFCCVALPTQLYGKGWSHETRIASSEAGRIHWLAGAFLSQVESATLQTLDVPGIEAVVPALAKASLFGLPTDRIYSGNFRSDAKQLALFFDGTAKLSDRVTLEAGIREFRYDLAARVDYRGALQGAIDTLHSVDSRHGLSPRFSASYSLAPGGIVYAEVAKGFRMGGANEPVSEVACAADLASAGAAPSPGSYGPDLLWNYEVGVKTSLPNQSVRLNASAFFLDYSDIQSTRRLPCGYSIVQNAGRLHSKGIELEGRGQLVPSLELFAAATLTDATLVETPGSFLGPVGSKAPYVPRWAYDVAATYRTRVATAAHPFASVEYHFTDARETDFTPAASLPMKAYAVVNVQLGIDYPSWAFFAFADNVQNSSGIVDRTLSTASTLRFIRTTSIRPRTIGITVTMHTKRIA
jgi:outer membrane receptor protein involved in Fe transport